MGTERQIEVLRSQMAAELNRLQRLTERRNQLLHLAVYDPTTVGRALRCNRQLADSARRAARAARAQLAELEGVVATPADGDPGS